MKVCFSALGCGLLFGAGLALSGMVQPSKVLGFLDVAGAFDPTLAVVMAGALGVLVPAQVIARRRATPLMVPRFAQLPQLRVDGRLFAGAIRRRSCRRSGPAEGASWVRRISPVPSTASTASAMSSILP